MIRSLHNADRPLLLLAYVDRAHAVRCGRFFRRLGWEVRLVASAAEARRLLMTLIPRAIVLDTDLPDESGWLTCAKITRDDPARYVILLTEGRSPQPGPDLVSAGAAALVGRHDPTQVLAETILGERLAEAI